MSNTNEESRQIAQINKMLKKEDPYRKLRKSRGWKCQQDLGYYYVIDLCHNFIVQHHVDLDELEQELQCAA